ncbi:MAG: replicative DNA helicase [Cellvibrio sp.]|uniref:replicative DNA helicase n=1 Tax=Cellvibrio sp. TaxID=1965322 RepID=UPI0031B4AD85
MPESSFDTSSFEDRLASELSNHSAMPHSVEAEQSVLGGLMLDNNRLDAVLEVVTESDFFRDDHKLIFRMMLELQEAGQPLDVITLSEELHKHDELERVGGLGYLVEMANNTPSAANIAAYAKIVRERSTLRQLIGAAQEISKSSMNPAGLDSDDLLQLAEKRVAEIAEDRPKEGGLVGVNELLKETVKRIDELFRSGSDITGVPSGITDLDQRTSGWQPGELIVLAARPSMGKTALALNFVEGALFNQARPVVVFSMEMPSTALVQRMMSSIGRIDQGKMRNGKLTEEDWPKLSSAVAKLKDKLLFIDDTGGLNPQEMRARIRRIAREHGNPGMIMVDYLQLMTVAGSGEGRTQEISEISRSLKGMAKEFECPMIALSQLNRGVEQRPNKRPMNSDLRESGAIEQDADVILFIYRDEYYNEDSPDKGMAELIIGKQRNGEIGTCRAAFVGKYTRFDNLAPEYLSQGGYD